MGVTLPTSENGDALPTSENGGTPLPVKMGYPPSSEVGVLPRTSEHRGAPPLPVKMYLPATRMDL